MCYKRKERETGLWNKKFFLFFPVSVSLNSVSDTDSSQEEEKKEEISPELKKKRKILLYFVYPRQAIHHLLLFLRV